MAVMIADGNIFFARDRLLGTCLPFRLFVCFDFYFTSVGDECCWLACGFLASRLLNPHGHAFLIGQYDREDVLAD